MDSALRQASPFGKYVLLERVSVGGMAEVFKAKAFGVEGFEKILAIKRILPSMAEDADFIEMFIDEAKICGQLNHANICQIYELGRVNESHFIAMEYVWGKDVLQMQNRFRKLRQKMKPEMAAYIACKICEGLDYAHKKKDAQGKPLGIIHRDISPQNILVSYEGELKVIDFGIAKAASRSSKTQAGVLKGKFGYMSPEQVRGLPLDRRSDIFAIGTILYELLTAERLFYGESDFETLEKVRNVEVTPPSTTNPLVPKALERIMMRALSKDVEGRYQWAAEMAEDLNGFLLSHEPAFSAQGLSQWMREQFAVEMRRERVVLDEQQKVTRDVLTQDPSATLQGIKAPANGSARPAQKSAPKAPKPVALTPIPDDSDQVRVDEDDDFNEKTTVSGPAFGGPLAEMSAAALPEQSTRILDGTSPLPGMSNPVSDLAAQSTVVFSDPSGSTRMPPVASPIDAKPFGAPVGDPSVVYAAPGEPSFTPHYGQPLAPPLPPRPRAQRSTVWKDILIGVAVAAVVVLAIVVVRNYMSHRVQATLVVLSPSSGGELFVDGASRGQLASGSPLTLKNQSPGEHQIVVHSDAGDFRQTVTLAQGDVTVVTATFADPAVRTGKLKLEIEGPLPSGGLGPTTADVYVDGAQISSEAAAGSISLRANASHEISITKQGFVEKKFSVDIKPNETVVRPVRLETAQGRITITTDPTNAEISINGHRAGVTPTTVDNLDLAHTARVTLKLAGYQSVTKSVSFDKGYAQALDVHLVAGKDNDGDASAKPDKPVADKPVDKPDKPIAKPSAKGNGKTEGKTDVKAAFPSDGLAPVTFGGDKDGKDSKDAKAGSQENGFLLANTLPWARIFLDGKDTGKTTPIAARSKIPLKPGKHVVTFVVSGKKYNFDIVIKAGEDFRLMKQLSETAP